MRSNEAALRELVVDPAELERRLELAEHAADEIDAASPRAGEVDELRARLAVAGNAQRIASLLAETYELVAGEGRGARDSLARASRSAIELGRLDPSAADLADRLSGLEAELDEVALDLRRREDSIAEAAADTASIEERLGVLYALMRKYGETEEALISYGEDARAEVDRLRGTEHERARRHAEGQKLSLAATEAAGDLHDARVTTAATLGELVTERLLEIGFPAAAFSVWIDDGALDESGIDVVTFLLAPNPGEPPRPLAKIASGGEMSRVALALKSVLARADDTPTLIFDEVDAGIGGRSADPIGRLLWRLGRDHQVIVVTHLAQIAAYADSHLIIEKAERDGRTTTNVEPLEGDARRHEIAQMLGGASNIEATLAAADSLLAAAAAERVPA
jgi:DNA repair protein RecN (Recombination protein N)